MNSENRKSALVIDCRMINASGIGTYLKNIIPGLVASECFLITVMGKEEELNKFPWFSKVSFIALKSKILSLFEQIELPLKIPKCDVYWSPNINGAILHTTATNRITTFHDVYHLAHQKIVPVSKLLFIKLMIKAGIYHSKYIITVSNFSKSEIVKYTNCAEKKIKVIPEAVSETFNSGFEFKEIKEPYILFVGNVKPHKNLQIAVEAFRELNIPNLRLYIIGKKEGFITGDANLLSEIEGLDKRIVFTGFVTDNDLKNYYANAKLFLFPSKYEGFGLPLLEAMKFGLPILASNASAIPEVGGDVVEYFDPNSLEDLKQKLKRMLSPNYAFSPALYRQQLDKFSWKKTIEQHIEILTATKEK